MSSIFQQLGYNYTPTANEIVDFDQEVLDSMNSMPQLLDDWQYEDLRNDDVARSNYFVNPVYTIVSSIRSICVSVTDACVNVAGLITISEASEAACTSADNFIAHTNRIAGLSEVTPDTAFFPHYDTAMGVGKSVMYMVYQSDGIQNNAPIMGSFTSLFIEDSLTDNYNVIVDYPTVVSDSVSEEFSVDPEDPEGPLLSELVTDLTPTEISAIVAGLSAVSNLMDTRRVHDENFYTNCNTLLNNFNTQKKFKSPGTSERNLINNFIGTTRLKNNLANTA
jgi:hypothetical protein